MNQNQLGLYTKNLLTFAKGLQCVGGDVAGILGNQAEFIMLLSANGLEVALQLHAGIHDDVELMEENPVKDAPEPEPVLDEWELQGWIKNTGVEPDFEEYRNIDILWGDQHISFDVPNSPWVWYEDYPSVGGLIKYWRYSKQEEEQ